MKDNKDLIEKGIFVPRKHHQLDYLIKKYEKNLREYLENSFAEYNINTILAIPYDIFQRWIHKSHDLEIIYYNKRMKVAVTLMSLNEIVLIP